MQAPGQVQREGSEGSREGLGGRSGRLWCRASSGSTGFRRRSQGSRKPWCKANRAPEKVPEKAWRRFRRRSEGFGAEPGQVQQNSGEGSGEGLGGFGAGPGQVQQGSGEGSGEGLGGSGAEPG